MANNLEVENIYVSLKAINYSTSDFNPSKEGFTYGGNGLALSQFYTISNKYKLFVSEFYKKYDEYLDKDKSIYDGVKNAEYMFCVSNNVFDFEFYHKDQDNPEHYIKLDSANTLFITPTTFYFSVAKLIFNGLKTGVSIEDVLRDHSFLEVMNDIMNCCPNLYYNSIGHYAAANINRLTDGNVIVAQNAATMIVMVKYNNHYYTNINRTEPWKAIDNTSYGNVNAMADSIVFNTSASTATPFTPALYTRGNIYSTPLRQIF